MNKPECIRLVRRVLRQRHSDLLGCVLFGSWKRDTANAGSDIDVVVLVESMPRPFQERVCVGGWLFDLFVFDAASLHATIRAQLSKRHAHMALALLSGEILMDRQRILEQETRHAAEGLGALPAFSEWRTLRLALTSLIRDVEFGTPGPTHTASCTGLYQASARCWHLLSCGWQGTIKHTVSKMCEDDAAYAERFDAALRSALDGRVAPLLDIARDLLQRIGGAFESDERLYVN